MEEYSYQSDGVLSVGCDTQPIEASGTGCEDAEKAPRKINIGGVSVTSLSRKQWGNLLLKACGRSKGGNSRPHLYTSANGNVLSLQARNRKFAYLMKNFDHVDADGMSLVFASRVLSAEPIPERCATTDFFHDMAEIAIRHDLGFFLLGGSEEINRMAFARVRKLYPQLRIVGRRNGYFMPDEERQVVEEINRAAPDILWVGMGVPQEHEFVIRYRDQLTNVSAIKTCGGLFDFLSGKNSRAPQWMQDAGFEWLYRLALEPRRLFVRYFVTNIHAIWLMLMTGRNSFNK